MLQPDETGELVLAQQLVRLLLLRWSEETTQLRKLYDRAEEFQRRLLIMGYGLGIPPSELIKTTGLPPASLYAKLDVKHNPKLKKRHLAIRKGDLGQFIALMQEAEQTLNEEEE